MGNLCSKRGKEEDDTDPVLVKLSRESQKHQGEDGPKLNGNIAEAASLKPTANPTPGNTGTFTTPEPTKEDTQGDPVTSTAQQPAKEATKKKPPTESPPSTTPGDPGTPTAQQPAKEATKKKPPTESPPSTTPGDTGTPTTQQPAKEDTKKKPPAESPPSNTPGDPGTSTTQQPAKEATKKKPPTELSPSTTPGDPGTPTAQQPAKEATKKKPPTKSPPSTTPGDTGTPTTQQPAKEDTKKKPPTESPPSNTPGDPGTSTTQQPAKEATKKKPPTESPPSNTPGDPGTSTTQQPAKEDTKKKKPPTESLISNTPGDTGTSTAQQPAKEDTKKKKPPTESPISNTPGDPGTSTTQQPAKEDTKKKKPPTELSPSTTPGDPGTPTTQQPAKEDTKKKPPTESPPSNTPGDPGTSTTQQPAKEDTKKKKPPTESLISNTPGDTGTSTTPEPTKEDTKKKPPTESPPSTTPGDPGTPTLPAGTQVLTENTTDQIISSQQESKGETSAEPNGQIAEPSQPTASSTSKDTGTPTQKLTEESPPSITPGDPGTPSQRLSEENPKVQPPAASPPSNTPGDPGTPSQKLSEENPKVQPPAASPPSNTPGDPGTSTPTRALIFSLEEENGITGLQRWMRRFTDDCHNISPTTTDWMSDVRDSSVVVFCSSAPTLESAMDKMKPYLEESVSVKGPRAVMVVIGDIQDPEDTAISEWQDGGYNQCELHQFTRTELQRIPQDAELQDMAIKIRRIREHLAIGSQGMSKPKKKKSKALKKSEKGKHGVIFFIQETEAPGKRHWLLETPIRANKMVDLIVASKIKKTGGPSSCVLHYSKKRFQKIIQRKNSEDAEIDGKTLNTYDKKRLPVVVVVDDLEDEDSEEEIQDQYKKTRFSQMAPLFLFRWKEKLREHLDRVSSFSEELKTQEKLIRLQESLETRLRDPETPETTDPLPAAHPDKKTVKTQNLGTVGIFSRSSNSDYSWMETRLRSDLSSLVSDVRSFYIANNQIVQFFDELQLCNCGILYHTKNRGRVNVTDVTDSLYDEELENMSMVLGRDHVIVVIDDLQDSSGEERRRILQSQPSIDNYACNLLLISERDKQDGTILLEKLREAMMSMG
ncbi:proteoglycan 4-like [Dendropsophus ebraccatus]|uniref:proteoglycan 4-like n=1 Tax=Dendropsophus ebraccatus TaxID=150705 RepID=UPI003832282D